MCLGGGEGGGWNCEERISGGTMGKEIYSVRGMRKLVDDQGVENKISAAARITQHLLHFGVCPVTALQNDLVPEGFWFGFSLNPEMVSTGKRSRENKVDCMWKQVPVDIVAQFHAHSGM